MAKITSELQVTVPKALAQQYGIRPGDEVELVATTTRPLSAGPSLLSPEDDRLYGAVRAWKPFAP